MLLLRRVALSPPRRDGRSYLKFLGFSSSSAILRGPRESSEEEEEYADIRWDDLGFGIRPTDHMYVAKCSLAAAGFSAGELAPYGDIRLSPSSAIINYGQGLFEGLKAYRKQSGRGLLLFRPQDNARRMQVGAERMCMPSPSVEQFVSAVRETVVANRKWIPPPGKGALYLRPLLIGSGAVLGLAPSPEYTFMVFASPVGNYFKEGLAPLNMFVDNEFHRATRGGTGDVKAITNYAPVLKAQLKAKADGFSDVIYLDSMEKRYLEEASSCNVFVVKEGVISTPATSGTILPGITRRSVIELARSLGFAVQERLVDIDEVLKADEVFCTGTAVVVASVGTITYANRRIEYRTGEGTVARRLYTTLTGIQSGSVEDKMGWTVEI